MKSRGGASAFVLRSFRAARLPPLQLFLPSGLYLIFQPDQSFNRVLRMVIEHCARFTIGVDQIVARMLGDSAELFREVIRTPDKIQLPLAAIGIGAVEQRARLRLLAAGVKAVERKRKLIIVGELVH